MVKNNVYYELFASVQVPNHEEVGYWIDLGADPHGNIIKFFDENINRWVKLTDATSEYATPPYIGNNGNWFIENRDSGVPAAGKNPYIGENNNWFVFIPSENKYVDTGIMAKGLSAYEIAVKHGYKGTEEEWVEYLRKPALDAAATALEAANKADQATADAIEATTNAEVATENAQNAADRSNEIADNPPKIVNEEWYMYDELTKEYKPTGIKAIGDPFEIKKTYSSIAEMEADYDNPMIGVGQFVWINTGNVEDEDDSKLFLKGTDGWILVGDLSGQQGIQGLSAYAVAVLEGFVGTQAEWIQSLKQPALDAADEALAAKAQVEATETSVKEAEALRVTAEESRVNAETTRESNEDIRKSNESSRVDAETARVLVEQNRVSAENIRNTNEETRKSNESTRLANESTRESNETIRKANETDRVSKENIRVSSEATRVSQETGRVNAEATRIASEEARKTSETSREAAENVRKSQEATRQANEAIRETQESDRQTASAEAITAVNEAKTAAESATVNATTAATNANTQANRAKEYSDNPPKIENDRWWVWDEVNKAYVNTNVFATGEPGKTPIIQDGTWWVYNNETSKYEDTLIPVTSQYELTKAKIEAVFTGDITTHNHDSFYYRQSEVDTKISDVNKTFDNYIAKDNTEVYVPTENYHPATKKYVDSEIDIIEAALDTKVNNTSVGANGGVAQLDSTGKVPASQLPSYVDDVLEYDSISDFPIEGEPGKIYIAIDTNITYRWSGTTYVSIASSLALGETSSTAYPGDKGKANTDKLATIEEGSQKNIIEKISARGEDLPVTNKRVVMPEDIAIGDIEPTGDELIWINTAEDYLFEFGGYTKEDADNKFVAKEVGKGLSTNDYTNEEKATLADKLQTVTPVGETGNVVSSLAKLGTDVRVYKTTVLTEADSDARYSTKTDLASVQTEVDSIQADVVNRVNTVNVTGLGNVITGAAKSGANINLTKDITALTESAADTRYALKSEIPSLVTVDSELSTTSINPVQNKVITTNINSINSNVANINTTLGTKVEEAPKDGKQYARMDGAWTEVEAMPSGETVKIIVTSNQAQPDADINGAVITITYGDNTKTLTWAGSELSADIPLNMSYTISCSSIEGYATPETKTYVALAGNTRNVSLSYNTTITTINVTSNQSSSDFVSSVAINLTGGFAKSLSGALSYTLKIPTGVTYNIVGAAVAPSATKSYTTPASKQVTSVGVTQSATINYTACKFTVAVASTEGSINPRIFIDKNGTNIHYTDLSSGSSTYIIVPMNSTDKYVVRGNDVTNYLTPANVTNISVNSASYSTTLTYAFLSEQAYAYWVIFDESQSTTTLERGGNAEVRDSIRAKFKRCLATPQANGKAAIAYTNDTDSTKWPDGTASLATAQTAGRYVMVHFPSYYYRNENLGNNKYKFYISERKLNDNYKEERECLIGTFEAFDNSGRLTSWYGKLSTGSQTISTFYNYARANGPKWGLIDYRAHKTIANMFAIMYGNTNISTTNSAIPCSGGTKAYNSGNTGSTVTLGNRDGLVSGSSNFLGLEDCYYSKWEFVQGVNIRSGGTNRVVYDGGCFPDKFDSTLTSAGATNVREIATGLSSSGYITKIAHGEYADVMPTAVGGSDTTYYADYNYGSTSGPYIFLRSGYSAHGALCGVFVSFASNTSSDSPTNVGSRLAFYGTIEVKTPSEWKALSPDFDNAGGSN